MGIVSTADGISINFQSFEPYMDTEIREDLAGCGEMESEQQFMREYERAGSIKYGDRWPHSEFNPTNWIEGGHDYQKNNGKWIRACRLPCEQCLNLRRRFINMKAEV